MMNSIDPTKAVVCVVSSVNFEQDPERHGLDMAMAHLRDNVLILGDEAFLADILAAKLSSGEIAASVCSQARMQQSDLAAR